MTKKEKVTIILDLLREHYGPTKCYLNHENPWQLLIATILSAQCTDDRVNLVTKDLFQKYTSIQAFAEANQAELEQDIVYKGGIEFPREGPELKQYLPRLCAAHPGWDGKTRWNVQQKEMRDLIRAGKAYDQRQTPKKKHRSHGGEAR